MLLSVLFGEELEVTCNHGFQKSLTLEEVKIIIADLTNIPVKQLQLQRVLQGKVEIVDHFSAIHYIIVNCSHICFDFENNYANTHIGAFCNTFDLH